MAEFVFLLEETAISGRARLVMTHADALIARGHRVRIVTAGAPVAWRSSRAEWVYVDELRQFSAGVDERVIDPATLPMAVDDDVFRDRVAREHEPLRVLLIGASQDESLAIDDGYGAVAHARWFHQKVELVRVSPWAPSRKEPLESVQEFHVALTTAEMTRLMHSCDIAVAAGAALSLSTAEAMAAGLACVITTPAAQQLDYPLSAPHDNAVELGERLIEVVSDRALRSRLRLRGREIAEQWRVDRALDVGLQAGR
ncbi:MAG TPA: glycosyltransferase [Thermoanaerobaculia bacterium]|nr:glycosyltransferase [Thermoanaerobaculia bacterium]